MRIALVSILQSRIACCDRSYEGVPLARRDLDGTFTLRLDAPFRGISSLVNTSVVSLPRLRD